MFSERIKGIIEVLLVPRNELKKTLQHNFMYRLPTFLFQEISLLCILKRFLGTRIFGRDKRYI